MLETKLETATLDNHKLQDKLSKSLAFQTEMSGEVEKKRAENARLMASLNEARA